MLIAILLFTVCCAVILLVIDLTKGTAGDPKKSTWPIGVIVVIIWMTICTISFAALNSSQLSLAQEHLAYKSFIVECELTSYETASEYPMAVGPGYLLDAQNALSTKEAIEIRVQCLSALEDQANREAVMNLRAKNVLNWPYREHLASIRNEAL